MTLTALTSRRSVLRCPAYHHTTKRRFSRTGTCFDHYGTLGVPRNASKAQIKSNYYQLSKKHHPDVSKDPASPGIFAAANEAYSVLINDRERRAYDRSLLHRSGGGSLPQTHSSSYSPHAPPAHAGGRRATHAWEYSYRHRTTGFRRPSDNAPRPQQSGTAGGGPGPSQTPPRESFRDVLKGARKREEENNRAMDQIRNTSSVVRAFQVLAALAASIAVMGGIPGG